MVRTGEACQPKRARARLTRLAKAQNGGGLRLGDGNHTASRCREGAKLRIRPFLLYRTICPTLLQFLNDNVKM